MKMLLAVATGGALGASLRWAVSLWMLRLFGPGFPWGTLTVNIVGSFLMGLVVHLFLHHLGTSQEFRSFLTTGVLGGFTTFSAFSLDVANMIDRHDYGPAMAYILLSVGLSILALFAGLAAGRLAWT